jgi:hypothetical protein
MRFLLPILFTATAFAQSPDIAALLDHRIIDANLPLEEVKAYTAAHVPPMPAVKTVAEWETLAAQIRRDAFDKVYFRGALARQWHEAKTKVEWLDTIPGGPGYHIKKVRYEALPGLWVPALLYQPDGITGKIPVHLALNGHNYTNGNAAEDQQMRCLNLAKRGVASLNVEWFNMRELHAEGFVHYRLNQLDLCGVSGLAPFYLAMSRGIDLLLDLPYADPKRVAVSGLSGGGWQTITISSLDPRVTLCNPVAGYSSFLTRAQFASDLGDSEQAPNDLALVADYTHLTAMLAGRAALLTFNAKDNCCFASDHALQPLLDAAGPIFKLYGQPERLRSHINYEPGTHNYEADNRQAFYRVVGDTFFPGDAAFNATETPFDAEKKTNDELSVRLPADNLDFHQLALTASKDLPHAGGTKETLAELVRYQPYAATAGRAGEETRGDVHAMFWKLRVGDAWTVPVVELGRGEPQGTTLVFGDGGKKSLAPRVEALLAAGQRVLAIDPFYFGESKIAQRDTLYALQVAAIGGRPLGIQASQLAAAARWAAGEFKTQSVALDSTGPRSSVFALVAAALETKAIGAVKQTEPLGSLHEIISNNGSVDQKPELFCFGLLESFDVPQLRQLVGAARLP